MAWVNLDRWRGVGGLKEAPWLCCAPAREGQTVAPFLDEGRREHFVTANIYFTIRGSINRHNCFLQFCFILLCVYWKYWMRPVATI